MAVNFQNSLPNYYEDQELLLCAKHAVNNILQEKKCVWEPAKGLLINKITGNETYKSVMIKNVQLNLHKFCESYPTRLAKQSGQNLEDALKTLTVTDKCDMAKGLIPFEAIAFILQDLGFRVEHQARVESLDKLQHPQLLGTIFNLGGGHYTALSKFLKTCKSWTRGANKRLTSVSYSYIDSYPTSSIKCLSKYNIEIYLKSLPISAVLYVYFNPTSYESISVARAHALNLQQGGKTTKKQKTLKQKKIKQKTYQL